jgi:hypothetical protein
MSANAKLMFGLGVVLAPWLFAVSASAVVAADETWGLTSIINVPVTPQNKQGGLTSTDIAFVDPVAGVYLLADRSNFAVDVINTRTNKVIKQLTGCSDPGASPPDPNCFVGPVSLGNGAGPNGVLLADSAYVWAGDGNSLVKVINLYTGALLATINTCPPVVAGNGQGSTCQRADELCFDPVDHIILIGNPSELTASQRFITFIDSNTYQILGRIVFDGAPGTGRPLAGGIEQCQWSQRTGTFYINLPNANGGANSYVLQIDPVSEKILNTVDVKSTGCAANNGMSIGPTGPKPGGGTTGQIGLGCTAAGAGSVIISEDFGTNPSPTVIATVPNTFTDEMWFNPGDNHYFFGNSNFSTSIPNPTPPPAINLFSPQLTVVDALGEDGASLPSVDTTPSSACTVITAPNVDPSFPCTAEGSNVVAVDPVRNQAYVVIKNTLPTATSLGGQKYKICSSQGGDDTKGCIAVYTVTSGTDDPGSCYQQGGSSANCPGVLPQ